MFLGALVYCLLWGNICCYDYFHLLIPCL